jgi:hypothetical protein
MMGGVALAVDRASLQESGHPRGGLHAIYRLNAIYCLNAI